MREEGRQELLRRRSVSRETLERLDRLVGLLDHWSKAINLVARSTLLDVWRRHILDSAQLLDLSAMEARSWADLGSGGGFPGLVIAALAAEERPNLHVTLVESDARKAAFLATALREMGVAGDIRAHRIETGPGRPFDVVSARALAPLDRLLDLAAPWLAETGEALFLKGAGYRHELTAAQRRWHSVVTAVPSIVDPDGVVLKLTEVRRAAAG
jgi:16S rRNA (guanine527-N7)-methyltransferase